MISFCMNPCADELLQQGFEPNLTPISGKYEDLLQFHQN